MISERRFAHSYGSTWKRVAPRLENFVRRANLTYERSGNPIDTRSDTSRRALVNEAAFQQFCTYRREGRVRSSNDDMMNSFERARAKIRRIGTDWSRIDDEIMLSEVEEAAELFEALQIFFRGSRDLVLEPAFPGCGIIDHCVGDVATRECIVEIKGGDRPFRSIDFRQVIVYFVLAEVSKKYSFGRICTFNPRRGVYVECAVSDFFHEISGLSVAEFVNTLSSEWVGASASR